MYHELTIFLLTLLVGAPVGVWHYRRLFEMLRERHDHTYEALGRPTVFNVSPRKSVAVQRFLYDGSFESLADEDLNGVCRFLRVFTPTFVTVVVIEIFLLVVGIRP